MDDQPSRRPVDDFADTVQFEPDPPAPPAAGAADSDLGLALASDGAGSLAEKPTLSHIGRYALKNLLGEGGLGCVYEAWDPLLSRTVAVKTLQFDLDAPSRVALDRLLLNEARAAANLNHAHIVTVYDAGLSPHGVYIAMERLRGRDLRQMLADGWQPTPDVATQIVRRVADALAYAHARGLIHCDIKPGNIFLTGKDKPKVLDFGIARAAHAGAPEGGDAAILGSPHYLAPEVLSGGAVDARSDLYALGVVLYELLAGRKAFGGSTLDAIHEAVRGGRATPLRELRPDLPPALCAIVERAMDLDPERRFASATELSQALRQWSAETSRDADADAATPRRAVPARAGLGVAAAAVILLAAWAALRPTGAPPAEAAATAAVAANARPASAAGDEPAAASPGAAPAGLMTAATATTPAGPAATSTQVAVPASGAATTPSRAGTDGARVARVAAPRPARPAAVAEPAAAAPATGTLQIAVSPWGEIEVDGRPAGTTPPLTQLSLTEGSHTITIRNADFAPHTVTVQVQPDRPVTVRHRFGS